jgi:hypothetical protein
VTPGERILQGRVGAYVCHSRGSTNTTAARAAFNQRFLDEVDPDRVLPEAERDRRASYARRAHFAKLALKSVQARRRAR